MKTEVCVLGSGSHGNSFYIRYGKTRLLIDVGLNASQIQRRLSRLGVSLNEISAILVTHEHGDHIRGAKVLCKEGNIPLWLNEKTRKACKSLDVVKEIREFQTGESFYLDGFQVDPIPLSHDAVDPVCFTLKTGHHKISVLTDLGKVEEVVVKGLSHSDLLILEFNHDVNMVENGPYFPHLKTRVLGERGHLSNEDSSNLLAKLLNPQLKGVVLAHVSQVNNHPDLAQISARRATRNSPYEDLPIYVSHQEFPGPFLSL